MHHYRNNKNKTPQEILLFQFHHCLNLLHRGAGGPQSCGRGRHGEHGRPEHEPGGPERPDLAEGGRACGHGRLPGRGLHGMHGMRGMHGMHHGMHRGQGRVLALLKEQSPRTQRELAELLHIQPPSLSEGLDKLEGRGLIERRPHPEDRRLTEVSITDEGRCRAEEVESARREVSESLLAGLTPEEIESLSGLLGKLISSLELQGGLADERRAEGASGPCPHPCGLAARGDCQPGETPCRKRGRRHHRGKDEAVSDI